MTEERSVVRKKNIKNNSRKSKITETQGLDAEVEDLPVQLPPQRVFLYIQLNNIVNLPHSTHPFELHLYHAKNTLQKMQEIYTTETIIYESEFNLQRPTFTMTVVQDSIDDMNLFSDNPLVITLYKRIPQLPKTNYVMNPPSTPINAEETSYVTPIASVMNKRIASNHSIKQDSSTGHDFGGEDEMEYEEEHLEFQSRGVCDLLQIFHRKRFISSVEVYLYPDYQIENSEDSKSDHLTTTVTVWHMYSIMPILKMVTFTNLAFLTMESIYNVVDERLTANPLDLVVSISFRSTLPNELGQYHVVPLCDYVGLTHQLISEQHTSVVWETLKRDRHPAPEFSYIQIEANTKIKLPKIFRFLLFTEGVNFRLDEINPLEDYALLNNSLHRFVLNNEIRAILEEAAVHNSYKLLMQLSFKEKPQDILYEGEANLSVFSYPYVKWVHYAIELRPPQKREKNFYFINNLDVGQKKKRKSQSSDIRLNKNPINLNESAPKPMFATFKICLFEPISLQNEPLDYYNEDAKKRCKLRRCFFMGDLDAEQEGDLVREFYRIFDETIGEIVNIIVKRNVHSFKEQEQFFCCQLNNLSNLLLKICGSDFNVRMPTKTNLEFREMLTHMYKELIHRAYWIVSNCSNERPELDVERAKAVRLLNEYKLLYVAGDKKRAEDILDTEEEVVRNKTLFSFYCFINDMENLRHKKVGKYLQINAECRLTDMEYFINLVKLYLDYKKELRNELTANDAFGNLMQQLREFTNINALDKDALILMYCYYKTCSYLPGTEYARMRYENLYFLPEKLLGTTPISLYEFYIDYDLNFNESDRRSVAFYHTFKLFVRLGMYDFAEIVFLELQSEMHPVESYLIASTLKLLKKEIDGKYVIRTFQTEKSERGNKLKYFLIHINGNLEFERNNREAAVVYFKQLLNLPADDELLKSFKLSLMRLGYYALEKGDYELALRAFQPCLPTNSTDKNYVVNYVTGKSHYHMGHLIEAIKHFSLCTEVEIHAHDAWAYLALINLRIGHNKIALECWKMAKLYPEMSLPEEIYDELQKIDYKKINLVVE